MDIDHQMIPSLDNCLNTCRGNIAGTCLEDRKGLIEAFYEGTYIKGMVEESVLGEMKIPMDSKCHEESIDHMFNISNENR